MILVGDKVGEEIANYLGMEFVELIRRIFPDGEVCPRISNTEKISNEDVIFFWRAQRPFDPNSYLVEILLTLRNLKELGAKDIYLVAPYYVYSRQDRISIRGEPLSSHFVKDMISNFAKEIFSVELHTKIDGITEISVLDDLVEYLRKYIPENPILVGPDKGSSNTINKIARKLNFEKFIMEKNRDPVTGNISMMYKASMDISNRTIILIDDILSSGKTLQMAADILRAHGASKIVGCIVHPIITRNLKEINLDEIAATNTIPSDISVIDVSKTIADFLKKKLKL